MLNYSLKLLGLNNLYKEYNIRKENKRNNYIPTKSLKIWEAFSIYIIFAFAIFITSLKLKHTYHTLLACHKYSQFWILKSNFVKTSKLVLLVVKTRYNAARLNLLPNKMTIYCYVLHPKIKHWV